MVRKKAKTKIKKNIIKVMRRFDGKMVSIFSNVQTDEFLVPVTNRTEQINLFEKICLINVRK